jgi:lipopolysaccharide/colanic/teichoic acid biosynthesis glycosyltransferase
LVDTFRNGVITSYPFGLFLVSASYLLFSWLFGSYTVLRWPWLRLRLVLIRLALASSATLLVLICAGWLLSLPEGLVFTERASQLLLLASVTSWSLGLRLLLRRLLRGNDEHSWHLMAEPEVAQRIQSEWQRNSYVLPPRLLQEGSPVAGVALLGGRSGLSPALQGEIRRLMAEGVPIASVQELAEQQLERLPPALLPEQWMAMHQIPWNNCFSVQRQLKRAADVGVSLVLLVLTMPLLLMAAFMIWLEDRGPVFYCQWRSGLMGVPFRLLKLRTMRSCQTSNAIWTQPGDCRITRVGQFLRRTRFDELPQLINVLRGEMSLIGPRPERPELEHQLEACIPHYRKRHWMPPGLSGWAQVCAPYASTLQEVELKLSYDLFYLRNWSTALDLLILAKTVKTVLKASGR